MSHSMRNYDHLLRLVLIGDYTVGKSSLIHRFVDNTDIDQLNNIGIDFRIKTVISHQKIVKLQIWDTSSQERFNAISSNYYKKADAVILVYDMTNEETFESIKEYWMKEVESYAGYGVLKVLIGNKSDKRDEQAVPTESAILYANQKDMVFFQVSSKTGENVQQCLSFITDNMVQEMCNTWGKSQKLKKIDLSSTAIRESNRTHSTCC